jgi:hypothetical protein
MNVQIAVGIGSESTPGPMTFFVYDESRSGDFRVAFSDCYTQSDISDVISVLRVLLSELELKQRCLNN